MPRPTLPAFAAPVLAALLLLAAACQPESKHSGAPGGAEPVEAIAVLNAHLIANDLAAFARDAIPPALHQQLSAAWQAGHTRWPLDELPLSAQHPNALAALAADDARTALLATFDVEVAGAGSGLRRMAQLLSIFTLEFIHQQEEYSASERAHYRQLVQALGNWTADAPLASRERAEQALDLLIPAARQAALTSAADFSEAGLETALKRMVPVIAAGKQALALYGLELDAALADVRLQLVDEHGDVAQVRMRYHLAGTALDVNIPLRRIDGRWYVTDFVDNATAAVAALPAPAAAAEEPADAP